MRRLARVDAPLLLIILLQRPAPSPRGRRRARAPANLLTRLRLRCPQSILRPTLWIQIQQGPLLGSYSLALCSLPAAGTQEPKDPVPETWRLWQSYSNPTSLCITHTGGLQTVITLAGASAERGPPEHARHGDVPISV